MEECMVCLQHEYKCPFSLLTYCFLPEDLGDVSEEQDKRFIQDIKNVEKKY